MERRKVMTIAAVLISVMVAAGACGKMMGDAPAPAEKSHRETGRHRQTVLKKLRQVRQIRKRMKKKE